jgi:hypothetical protein
MDTNGKDRSLGTLSSPQRNNYFYGKLMDVSHFEMEQRYGMKKRWLLNRLGLGTGVLCGLRLTVKDDKVCVSPGVAIDGCGHEIVVPHEVCIDPWTLTDECGCPKTPALLRTEPHDKVLLCLAYKECQTDFMPVLVTDCNTKQHCLPGTTVEGFCVIVKEGEAPKPEDGLHEELCQFLRSDATEQAKRHRLCELVSKGSCLVPDRKEPCVLLGTVSLTENGIIDKDDKNEPEPDQCSVRSTLVSNEHLLDMLLCLSGKGGPSGGVKSATAESGTPVSAVFKDGNIHFVIPPGKPGADGVSVKSADAETATDPATKASAVFDKDSGNVHFVIPKGEKGDPGVGLDPNLTKVNDINWRHDRPLQYNTFKEGLRVTFSNEVVLTTTIGRAWFLVFAEFESPQDGTIVVDRVLEQQIDLVDNDKVARFFPAVAFEATFKDRLAKLGQKGALLRVVVKGDFILDKQTKKPVDTNPLAGNLHAPRSPMSGDGVPGGDFESWFTLTL